MPMASPNCSLRSNPPTISVVTAVYATPPEMLRRMVRSIQQQSYPHWELCLVDDGSPDAVELEAAIAPFRSRIQFITQPNSDPSIDLSAFNAAVASTSTLLDLADQKFYYGRMPAQVRTAIATAIDANTDNPSRVFTAVYLAVLAGQYQTQY